MSVLAAEWLRLRRSVVLWGGLAGNVAFLLWNLWNDFAAMRAHGVLPGSAGAAFWNTDHLLPYVFQWGVGGGYAQIVLWTVIGAWWAWDDWRPGMAAEHVTRCSRPGWTWAWTRLASLAACALVLQIVYVMVAYVIGFALGEVPNWSRWQLTLRLAGVAWLYPWVVGAVAMAWTAIWENPVVGSLLAWGDWWLQRVLFDLLRTLIAMRAQSPGLAWALVAIDPFNNLIQLGMSMGLGWWGYDLQQAGAISTERFFPRDLVGITFGYVTTGRGVEPLRYDPPIVLLCLFLVVELSLLWVWSGRAYVRRQDPARGRAVVRGDQKEVNAGASAG